MASEQLGDDKNSQELTGAALELVHDGKNDNDNADAAQTVGTEAGGELPIRDATKGPENTAGEKEEWVANRHNAALTMPSIEGAAKTSGDGAAAAELRKGAVAMSLENGVFQHGFEEHKFIPLILPNSISEDEKTVSLESVRVMKPKHVDLVNAKL